MQADFIIQKWAAWPSSQDDAGQMARQREKELLAPVPGLLRRRLSRLAKTVFCAANQCIEDAIPMPVVFSSSHGELARSFALMQMLEAGEEISPTAFSLSVHNAIAGLFSMASHNTLQSTVIAPGAEGMSAAFIESAGLLLEGAGRVLLIFYDEPLVDFYPAAPFPLSAPDTTALALRISNRGPGMKIHMSSTEQAGNDGEQPVQLPAFIHFLSGSSTRLILNTPRHGWCWEKYVASR